MNNFTYGYGFTDDSYFTGKYVSDYNEVINTPSPINGSAIIFADLNSLMLYSKKVVNGTALIQPYKLQPIYQEAVKPEVKEDPITLILNKLESMELDINKLKGENKQDAKPSN